MIGLAGVLVGSFLTFVTGYAQARLGDKRARTKLVVDAAIAEHAMAINIARSGAQRRVGVAPLTAYIFWNDRVLNLLDSGKLNAKSLARLRVERDELMPVFEPVLGSGSADTGAPQIDER